MTRTCHDCGSTVAETRFQFVRKPIGGPPDRCCDCAAEAARLPLFPHDPARAGVRTPGRRPRTRRAYRAALRHRAGLAQGDLVDLVVRSP